MVTLTIDGKEVTVKKTATIYEAAKEAGVDIPVLCYAKKLLPYGACRVCLVEVEQMKGRLIPACTTPVTEGMTVNSTNDEIRKVRKTVLEFLLVNHVLECPVCDKGGECDLQDLTYEYEVNTNRFEGVPLDLPTDEVNPLIERNMNRCVLCGKCARVCDEVVGYGSYSFINRGFESKIATAFDRGLDCEFCGQCLSMCPVGALLPRPFKFKARPWQLKEVDSVCGYCGNGCTVCLGVKDNKVETIRFNDKTGVNDGNLCVRGRFGYSYVNSEERLTKPLVRKDGQLVEVEWDEALQAVVQGFGQAKAANGVGVIAGGRLTNEEYFLLKNLSKQSLNTSNLDHSGGECYKGVTEGLQETLGVQASTGTFPQVEDADAILAIRSDFYETHPVFGMVVNQAVKRNGAKLTVLSDKLGKFTKLEGADTLQCAPGTEVNVLNGLCQVLIEENLAATEGVEGLDQLKASLSEYTPEKVEAQTGVVADSLKQAARQLAEAGKSAILLAHGLPYSASSRELGVATANLAILCGNAGSEGSGLYLCGEKANSQGAIDHGILPANGGMGAQQMLEAAGQDNLSALYIVGEDPLSSYPNRSKVEAALNKGTFVVVQDMFLSATAEQADVVLPATSFAEKDGTFTNAERRIQRVRAGLKAPEGAFTDFDIFQKISAAMGGGLTYTGAEAVFAELGKGAPAYAAVDFGDIGAEGTVWGGENLTVAKKQLVAVAGGKKLEAPMQLITGSALYHSGTVSTRSQGPNAVVPEPYVELARDDAKALGVAEGDKVSVKAGGVSISLDAKVDNRLPKGVVFVPYHFASAGLNRIYQGEAAIAVEISK